MLRPVLLLTVLGAAGMARAAVPALMPMPAKLEISGRYMTIYPTFQIAADGGAALAPVVQRYLARVAKQTGIILTPDALRSTLPGPGPSADMQIECAPCAPLPALGQDESYQLDVTVTGARLKATTVAGVLHGLETFLQLIQLGQVPAVHIEDRPRFAWRGLMLDCSRHFLPLAVIRRNLDAMAAVKLNVFHWHLSDDQGFRAESKLYPRLTQFGSDGDFYTQDQMRQVVAYAAARGIRVVPEFDIPGHTGSWFPGYPDLAAGPGPFEIGRHFGVFDPVLNPAREDVYTFLDGFIGEMAAIFPDPFFHVGGDEVNGKAWKESAEVQAFAKAHDLKDTLAIQTYFNQRIEKILRKYGKNMIGWDEIFGPDLPANAVIQSWRGADSLAAAASKGYQGILSAGYYLDHLRPAAYHYAVDPLAGPAAQLTPEQAAHILGGEACMWAEMVDAETVDSRVWPRAAAIAERFWSARELTDVDSMYARLEAVSRQLQWTGVTHRSSYPEMLDRLAGDRPAEALRVLADACEARGLGTGRRARDSQTPLNRFVDAARPESETVRHLEQLAHKVADVRPAGTADLAALRARFSVWAANDALFQALAEDNSLLAEVKPLSKDLSALGTMGLQILDHLASSKSADADWMAAQTRELTRMARTNAEVLLAGTRPVKVLLEELARRK
jgi:hexosaminidase